jgi:hypothetical protein
MATPTGPMPCCTCPTAPYPPVLAIPTPIAPPTNGFLAPATLGIWAGSIAGFCMFFLAVLSLAPHRRAWLFQMDDKILQLQLRALLTPQEQWRLERMVEERERYAKWYPKYLWWLLWRREPPIPPIVVINLAEELEEQPEEELEQQLEEEQQEERHGWTLNNGGLPTFVEMRTPRPRDVRRRRERQSLSWRHEPPS